MSVTNQWRGDQLLARVRGIIRQGVQAACFHLEGEMKKTLSESKTPRGGRTTQPAGYPPAILTGKLRQSVTSSIKHESPTHVTGRVGTHLKYGKLHEFGGHIFPTTRRHLAIPLSLNAVRLSESAGYRNLASLNLQWRPTKTPGVSLLGRDTVGKSRGKWFQEFEALFLLVPWVIMPARPWMRPTCERERANVANILRGYVAAAMRGLEAA